MVQLPSEWVAIFSGKEILVKLNLVLGSYFGTLRTDGSVTALPSSFV